MPFSLQAAYFHALSQLLIFYRFSIFCVEFMGDNESAQHDL